MLSDATKIPLGARTVRSLACAAAIVACLGSGPCSGGESDANRAGESASAGESAKPATKSGALRTLSVVGINDLHGHLEQLPLLGGYLKNLRAVREREHGAVLVLDAGDMFQGTLESNLTEGAGVLRAYRALGVDAAALGNHEFDYGPVGEHPVPLSANEDPLGALAARVREASFPFLTTNLVRERGGALPLPELKRSVQLTAAGVKVGVVGGLTIGALSATHADNVRGLHVLPLAPAITLEAAALRAAGARIVIALVHAGGECRDVSHPEDASSCKADSEVFELARALPKGAVDLIVAGHTHGGIAQLVAGIPIIESYSNGRAFGRVDLLVDESSGTLVDARVFAPQAICAETLSAATCALGSYERAMIERDPRVADAIAVDVANAEAKRGEALGIMSERAITRSSSSESALGNLVADAMLHAYPGADVAINNAGSLRKNLPAGPLDFGAVFEVYPFDDVLTTLQVRASDVSAIVKNSLRSKRGIVAIAGLRAVASCESGELQVALLRKNGKPIAGDTKLTLVTTDYLAKRGDGLLRGLKLDAAAVQVGRDRPVRDAVIAALRRAPHGRLDADDKERFDPAAPRLQYPGTRPVRCPKDPPIAEPAND